VHGQPPGQEGQETVLEDDPIEGDVVAPARVFPLRADAGEGKAAKEREPEPFGLEPRANGRAGPIEQRAAELRRGELGQRQDGDGKSQDAGGDQETALQRVSAACSIARAYPTL